MSQKQTLTNRDLNTIYDKISELFVKDVCDTLIQYDQTNPLAEAIQTKMTSVLNEPSTINKLQAMILQNVNMALRNSTNGPILLYALLTKNAVIIGQVTGYIRKFMELTYTEGDTATKFGNKFVKKLYDPPYSEWFPNAQLGGRKSARSTRRKRKTKKRIRKNKTLKGGLGNPFNAIASGVRAVGSKASDAASRAADGARAAKNAIGMGATAVDDTASDAKNALLGRESIDAGEIEQTAIQLHDGYSKTLIDMATKKLDKTTDLLSKKMVNASYVYMLKHSDSVLNSTLNSIESTIMGNANMKDMLPILVVQALFNSRNEVMSTIRDVYDENKKNGDKVFDPTKEDFVTNFIGKLVDKLKFGLNIEK